MASAAYERRNARARALGYTSYYDYRAHDNGKIPPGQPRLAGRALRRARGHTSLSDLIADTKPGTLIMATPDPTSRRADGTYSRVHVTMIGEDGSDRDYLLRGQALSSSSLDRLVAGMSAAGAVFSPSPSLDLRAHAKNDDDDPYGAEDMADLEDDEEE